MSNQKAPCPFYVHPMNQKRSIQIIKETKAEIKKMESHRPLTPFGRQKSGKEHNLPVSSRPSSSSSLKSLIYEQEDEYNLSARRGNNLSDSKVKDACLSNVKLEPLVTKAVITSKKGTTLSRSHSQQDIIFPPIKYKGKDNLKNIENPAKHEVSLQTLESALSIDSRSDVLFADSTCLNQKTCETDCIRSSDPEEIEKMSSDSHNSEDFSQELRRIQFLLNKDIKLGTRKSEQITLVCKLYNLLEEGHAFQLMHCDRTPLLKTLFKLLDSNLPVLSLHVIRLLLKMKVKDKNFGTIFRLMSRFVNNKHINFLEYELVDPLIEAVEEVALQSNKETVLYGTNILKTFIFRNELAKQQVERCTHIFIYHLSQFNDMMPTPEERCDDAYIEINKQIFITLHHLAETEDFCKLLSNELNLTEILKGLGYFYQNSSIIQIIVRLISKIIDKEEGCQAFAQCPEKLVMVFTLILQTHRYNIDITVQTTFIIGNLVLIDKNIAETFLKEYNLHGILIKILEEYVREHTQPKRMLSENFKIGGGDACSDRNWHQEVFEVISRILCILANMCLSSDAGFCLAQESDTITDLLYIISSYSRLETLSDASLPMYSFLVVIGNISYYLSPNSATCLKIAKRVIPLLDDKFSFEVRRESANIVQNLTRSAEVRNYIKEYSLVPAFVKLLSEDDKEFNVAAYGIIMNLLLDKNNHQIFYREQGISRILHKLHLCTERDWKTSSVLLQILWNYCKCLDEDDIPISRIEAQHLIKYLSYSTNLNENMDDENSESYFIWKNEFCPVADKLLALLLAKSSSIT